MGRVLVAVMVGALMAQASVLGNQDRQTARFEVVSIKPSDPSVAGTASGIPLIVPAGDRVTATNVTLRLLMRIAYERQDAELVGGPAWQTSRRFDIVATAGGGRRPSRDEMHAMLRTLLAERFTLSTHLDTRERPVSSLVLARDRRLGPALVASTVDCERDRAALDARAAEWLADGVSAVREIGRTAASPACGIAPSVGAEGIGLRASGLSMPALAQFLTQATGIMVRDRTGLTGRYDWRIRVAPEALLGLAGQAGIRVPPGLLAGALVEGPSLTAALEEQLGLALVTERVPMEVLVIDGAELPTPD